jgi:CHASE1-domain containing sensor protein
MLLALLFSGMQSYAGVQENALVDKSQKLEEYATYSADQLRENTDEVHDLLGEVTDALVSRTYHFTNDQRQLLVQRINSFRAAYDNAFASLTRKK